MIKEKYNLKSENEVFLNYLDIKFIYGNLSREIKRHILNNYHTNSDGWEKDLPLLKEICDFIDSGKGELNEILNTKLNFFIN